MVTAVKLRPADHGRAMTREEFDAADGRDGYRYELIDGRVFVSPPRERRTSGWSTGSAGS